MAVEAPVHAQRFRLLNDFHLIDASMTCRAANGGGEVHAVIEECVVREHVNADPRHRFSRGMTLSDRSQCFTFGQHGAVTVHAGRCRGNRGMSRVFHRVVAVAAIESEVASMQLVAEWHGLFRLVADIREFG